MKKTVFFFISLMSGISVLGRDTIPPEPASVVASIPESPDWHEFRSYVGRFRIYAPGEFIEKVDSIPTPVGKLAYHTFFYQPPQKDADNLLYMVSYCDYPEYSVHSDSLDLLDEFFQTTLDAATSSMRGELLYSDRIELQGYPGRIWRIDYLNGRAIVKTRAFLSGRRYFSLQTITLKEKSLNLSSDKFMDSFRLLE
jgi:hypothetical protein